MKAPIVLGVNKACGPFPHAIPFTLIKQEP